MSSLRTVVEIMMKAASCTVSEVPNGLPKIRNEQRHTQLAPSAMVQATLLMQQQKKSGDHNRGPARVITVTAHCRFFDSH